MPCMFDIFVSFSTRNSDLFYRTMPRGLAYACIIIIIHSNVLRTELFSSELTVQYRSASEDKLFCDEKWTHDNY